jgi:hypothetical protein
MQEEIDIRKLRREILEPKQRMGASLIIGIPLSILIFLIVGFIV